MAFEKKEGKDKKSEEDILDEAKKMFAKCEQAESGNRDAAIADLQFGRLGDQWAKDVTEARGADRPVLTINRLPAFVRQVVNDARQNKPQIKVRPVDSGADPKTAEVMSGLVRNIEQASDADVAYDTAAENAVWMGFGYWRVNIGFAHDESFDKEIRIERIANPFTVYGDPMSTAADSSDWNHAFVVDYMPKDEFEAKYGDREKSDWDNDYANLSAPWKTDDGVLVCEYWCRKEIERAIVKLSDGRVMDGEIFETQRAMLEIQGTTETARRPAKSFEVIQYLMTGAEIIETTKWAGKYIPIVPVYGDEVNEKGKRHFRSLIRDAKDAQKMFNYWRSTATEIVALAPRVPYIGPEDAFTGDDAAKWQTANSTNHAYISYGGAVPPQRQQLDGGAAVGALREALSASDDLKDIMGLHDASLGAKSNETSGKAILARQREGDVSTFHFIDNVMRAIRHTGRILLDLIPKVYTGERIVRVLGNEGQVSTVPVNQPFIMGPNGPQPAPPETPEAQYAGIYRLDAGKYDLTVEAGPNFTTQRQEAAEQMTAMFQAMPESATVLGDLWAKMQDWPYADEIAKRLKALREGQQNQPNPEAQKFEIEKQRAALQTETDSQKAAEQMRIDREKAENDVQIEWTKANAQIEIERVKAGVQLEMKRDQVASETELKAEQQASGVQEKQSSAVKINLGENVAQSFAETVGPMLAQTLAQAGEVMAQTLSSALQSVTLKTTPMIRVPVRDPKTKEILYTRETPDEGTIQ